MLGDARRTKRLVQAAAELCARPAGRLTQVYRTSAQREAAFRLIENDSVDWDGIARASHRATTRECADKQMVCVALDQTGLSIVDRGGTKFGRMVFPEIGRGGVQAMSGLAIDEQTGSTIGTVALEYWLRPDEPTTVRPLRPDPRPEEDRESALWKRAISSTLRVFEAHAPRCKPWFQMDRGADYGAVLWKAHREQLLVTVRAAYDRALSKRATDLHLWERMSRERPMGSFPLKVPARDGRPARVAHLCIRAARVSVPVAKMSQARRTQWLDLCAVHVREISIADEPIEWMLWTTYNVKHFGDAYRVVTNYAKRWRIEEFHRAWKSSVCNIEGSQLRSVGALQRWGAMTAAVAARAEHLKLLSRTEPDKPAIEELTRDEIDAAILLSETKKHRLGDALSLGEVTLLIAQVGGYTGKSSGGPPGTIVISRGLRDVMIAARGLARGRSG